MATSRHQEPADSGRPAAGQDEGAAALRWLMRDARSNGPLGPSQQATLLERAALGDRTSQDRLVAANLDSIIRLAGTRDGQGLSVPDLVQEGSIGLLQAIRTYAGSGETDFVAFAEALIGAQMDAALAAESAAVREGELLVAAATDYERAELIMRRTLNHEPTTAELAEKLEWTTDRTLYVAQVVADARSRYDEEMLAFIGPEAVELTDTADDEDEERAELDG